MAVPTSSSSSLYRSPPPSLSASTRPNLPPHLCFYYQFNHLHLRTSHRLSSSSQESDALMKKSRRLGLIDFVNEYVEEDGDDDDVEEEDRSLDLLVRFVESLFKVSKRSRKALRSVFPVVIPTKLLALQLMEPHETYVYFMDLLAKTVRDEIAGCSEKAYDYLSVIDAQQMLLFFSQKDLIEYIYQDHPEWEIKGKRIYLQKAKESTPCKEIPSLHGMVCTIP